MTATLQHPGAVLNALEQIEKSLAEQQNDYEQAASDRATLVRKWEKRLALCRLKAKGNDADARKAAALVMAIDQDDLYERLMDAEGRFEGCRASIKVSETRAMIGLGILRSQGRS